jgi:molybdopterin converting factor small subunit
VKVLFFGVLRDVVGRAEDQLDLDTGVTLGGVFEHYSSRFPRMREMAGSILLARKSRTATRSPSFRPSAAVRRRRARFRRTATFSP